MSWGCRGRRSAERGQIDAYDHRAISDQERASDPAHDGRGA